MNIMLVSVTERIREIGLRKALGGRPRLIRRQFLVEASMLGLAGGVLGVGLGVAGAAVLPHLTELAGDHLRAGRRRRHRHGHRHRRRRSASTRRPAPPAWPPSTP